MADAIYVISPGADGRYTTLVPFTAGQFSESLTGAEAQYAYASRASLPADASLPDGTIVAAGGLRYEAETGATVFADKPGWKPVGDFFVGHWGAASDGDTDDTVAVQRAATWVSEQNATLHFPVGYTRISDEILVTKAMRFVGQGMQANAQKTLADTRGIGSRLIWSESGGVQATKAMIKFLPPSGTFLIAPEVDQLIVDCNSRAGFGVWIGAAWQPRIGHLHVHAPTDTGLYFFPEGGNTIVPQVQHYFMTVSNSADCLAASGLRAVPSATGFLTGGHYDHVRVNGPTLGTGVGFEIGNCDSAHVDYYTAFGFTGTGGRTFHASHDPLKGGGSCRKFFMDAFGGGRIKADEGCYGLNIRATSETSELDVHPDAQVNLELIDQYSGDHYQTLRYKFTDEVSLSAANNPHLVNVTESTQTAVLVQVLEFANNAADGTAAWSLLIPPEWNHGAITGVKLYYCTSALETANWYVSATARCWRADGSADINPPSFASNTEVVTLAVPGNASRVFEQRIDFATECLVKKRMGVTLQVRRQGANAADTATVALRLVGARLMYRSDGPNGGSGEARTSFNPIITRAWSLEDYRDSSSYDEDVG